MKKNFCLLFVIVCALMGCKSISPYDYGTNWLIRENDIPQYYSDFDLFYICVYVVRRT